jgi:hypothetical protein
MDDSHSTEREVTTGASRCAKTRSLEGREALFLLLRKKNNKNFAFFEASRLRAGRRPSRQSPFSAVAVADTRVWR